MPWHKVLQAIYKFIPQLERVDAGRNRQFLIKLQTINYHLHTIYKKIENITSVS